MPELLSGFGMPRVGPSARSRTWIRDSHGLGLRAVRRELAQVRDDERAVFPHLRGEAVDADEDDDAVPGGTRSGERGGGGEEQRQKGAKEHGHGVK